VPADRRQRMGESGSAARGRALLKKGPVIGGGSRSREKRQSKSIRGRGKLSPMKEIGPPGTKRGGP
jgi:hypothetical protein